MKTVFTRLLLTGLAAGLVFTGCAEEEPTGQATPVAIGEAQAGLIAFQTCEDLEGYIKGVALAELEKGFNYISSGKGIPPMAGMSDTDDAAVQMSADATGEGGSANNDPTPPADPEESGNNKGTSGPAHSGTNNQVTGVDEADLVKTDGNFLYVASGSTLRILKALPAEQTEIVSELKLVGGANEMFLHGDTLLVYGNAYGGKDYGFGGGVSVGSTGSSPGVAVPPPTHPAQPPQETEPMPEPEPEPGEDDSDGTTDDEPEPASKPGSEAPENGVFDDLRGGLMLLTFVDVSDRTNPDIVRTMAVESRYASARMIGSVVYTVARGQLFLAGSAEIDGFDGPGDSITVSVDAPPSSGSGSSGSSNGSVPANSTDPDDDDDGGTDEPPASDAPDGVPSPGKSDDGDTPDDGSKTLDEYLAETKQKLIDALNEESLDDWMPKVMDIKDGETTTKSLADCGSFYKPTIQLGLNTVSVIAIDLANPAGNPNVATTLGQVGTIYASKDALYAAHYVFDYWYYNDEEDKSPAEYTMIHKFEYADAAPKYAASGKIDGRILNQFSMDEHDGHLRVATTINDWTTDEGSTNNVYVMETANNTMQVTGSVTGLAGGERIYSARFIGDRGYVVTFKQIDPLFTLDLSNPAAPAVGGELKIPGFSTYIHPLGSDHLLTIGRDVLDNGDWQQVDGIQVQIFDVADITTPTLAHKATFGGGGTSSEALYDHKAFSFFADKGLLAIPYNSYGGEGGGGVTVVEVDGGTATPDSDPATDEGGSNDEPGGEEPPDAEPTEDPKEAPDGEPTDPEPPMDPDDDGNDDDEDGVSDEPWTPPVPQAGVMVFSIDADAGITTVGDISHTDLVETESEDDWWYYRSIQVRRTLLIEDNLYTVGTAGVKVNTSTPDLTELAAVKFPPADDCWDCPEDKPISGGTGTPQPMPAPDEGGDDEGDGEDAPTPGAP